ncbi:MAG: AAA family ATPase, partial [Candidatus Bathyarchaeota archaeon]
MPNELSFEKLRTECDPKLLMDCETTKDISPLEGIIGQDRAVRALSFGLDIKERGFNIYVAGYPGTGRTTAVKDFLEEIAKTKSVPQDWCYVNNFSNSYEPNAISLSPGKGRDFQRDIIDFINEARRALPKTFESEEYAVKKDATIKIIEQE